MGNLEKLATQCTQEDRFNKGQRDSKGVINNGQSRETSNIDKTKKKKTKTQYNMCWTPLYVNTLYVNTLYVNTLYVNTLYVNTLYAIFIKWRK